MQGIRISDICRDWASVDLRRVVSPLIRKVSWCSLEVDLLKLNFDGSCMREYGLACFGGVIRELSWEIRLSFVGPFSNGSMIDAELHALWRGY